MPFDQSKIPNGLVKAIQSGDGVLFVGAGLSVGAGLPQWKALLQQMIVWCTEHRVNLRGHMQGLRRSIQRGELIDAAQTLRERMGDQRFYEFVVEVFRRPELTPTENHLLLPALSFSAVLTSNFDKLIEDAYARLGHPPRVYTQRDTAALANLHRDKEFYVLKVHGDVDRVDTIVLGQRDFRQALFSNNAFKNFFGALRQTKTLLFIGFSLDDPDVTLRFDELAEAFKDYGGYHYALMSSAVPIEVFWHVVSSSICKHLYLCARSRRTSGPRSRPVSGPRPPLRYAAARYCSPVPRASPPP
jgi:hypothetical protein